MNKVYKDILSKEQCDCINKGMLSHLHAKELVSDNTPYTNGSLGFYNLKEALFFLPHIDKIIKNDFGSNITFENNYTRIYKHGNDLKIHTDRDGLDLTLSICTFSNLNHEWPLYISNSTVNEKWSDSLPIESYKLSFQEFYTPEGTGMACYGTKSPHWRDKLICNEDQYVIQSFFHWKINS